MPIRPDQPVPYAPKATIVQVIGVARDRGLAATVTEESLQRMGVSESLIPRTFRSLQGLDLLTKEGKPTEQFETLRRAPTEEYRLRLEELVRGVYAPVFLYTDPAKDDVSRVEDAFRGYEPSGQRNRMVSLFLGLCEEAGIIPTASRKQAAPGAARPAARKGTNKRDSDSEPARPTTGKHSVRTDDALVVPESILGLVRGIRWSGVTKSKRDQIEKAFGALLDLDLPIIPEDAAAADAAADKIG